MKAKSELFPLVPEEERGSGAWVWVGKVVEETGLGGEKMLASLQAHGVRVGAIPFPSSGVPGLYVDAVGYERWKSLAEWYPVTTWRVGLLPGEGLEDVREIAGGASPA